MPYTTIVELMNRKDTPLTEADVMKPEDVQHITIDDAIVKTS